MNPSTHRHYNQASVNPAGPQGDDTQDKPQSRRALRILIINQSFWPDVVATAQQAHDLAAYLTSGGDSVTVVSSRSLYGRQGATLSARECVDGIEIHRVSRNLFQKRGLVTRAVDYARFGFACLIKCLLLPRQDVVICLTTPPFIALIGALLRLVKGSRFVLWSMDLYPDLPAQAGIIRRGGIFHRLLRLIDVACLRSADKIVVLGSCMYDRIRAKRIASSRIEMIHPWSNPDEFGSGENQLDVVASRNKFRMDWGIGDRFVIEYSGNYGLGHDVDTVARAMLRTKDDDSLRWVIVGDGIMKPSIVSFVNEHRIANVIFQPYQPRSLLGPLIQLGDIHLVLMMPGYEGIILPSKLYGILAAGRPAVFVGPAGSEVARVIEREHCGYVVPNGDDARLVEVLQRLRDDPGERESLGSRGRAALQNKFSMGLACAAWRRVLHGGLDTEATDRDRYRQAGKLHVENIASGFLAELGAEFMSVLYRSIDESPTGVFHVEKQEDRVVGFVAGTTGKGSLLRGLLGHIPSTLWSLRRSLLRPSHVMGMIRLMVHLSRGPKKQPSDLPAAELLSIAVARDARGQGVAERLYHKLERSLVHLRVDAFKIIVGAHLNESQRAHRFYTRMGARDVGVIEVHAGQPSTVYVAEVRIGAEEDESS